MAKSYNRSIDIVIPAYNVKKEILARCLSSIACQDIIYEAKVTIVDDASDQSFVDGYNSLVSLFSELIDIQMLRLDVNGGPGVARQYGMDQTFNGYITFIDADDTFIGSLALKVMRNSLEINGDKNIMVSSVFDEIHEKEIPSEMKPGPMVMPHQQDMIWMFGKMYRRRFIDENNIKFHPTSRANEDNGFNHCIQLISDENHQIVFNPIHTYYWHETEESITRHADCEYAFGGTVRDSFYGYCENMAYAINFALKKNPFNGAAQQFAAQCMLIIYQYYIECVARANEHAESNFKHAKMYYKDVFEKIENTIPENILSEIYSGVMRNAYMGGSMMGFIPSMTIREFLDKMKED